MTRTVQKTRPIEVTVIALWAIISGLCYLPAQILINKIFTSEYNPNPLPLGSVQLIFLPMGFLAVYIPIVGVPISVAWIFSGVYVLRGRLIGYALLGTLLFTAATQNVLFLIYLPSSLFLLIIEVGLILFILKNERTSNYFRL